MTRGVQRTRKATVAELTLPLEPQESQVPLHSWRRACRWCRRPAILSYQKHRQPEDEDNVEVDNALHRPAYGKDPYSCNPRHQPHRLHRRTPQHEDTLHRPSVVSLQPKSIPITSANGNYNYTTGRLHVRQRQRMPQPLPTPSSITFSPLAKHQCQQCHKPNAATAHSAITTDADNVDTFTTKPKHHNPAGTNRHHKIP